MEQIIVTRHPALVEYLIEKGLVEADTPVHSHVSEETVRGKHVFGVLPAFLAVEAGKITEIPLKLSPEDRGKELSVERMREVAGEPWTYKVTRC